jgi:SAM-dependent methyltransferase
MIGRRALDWILPKETRRALARRARQLTAHPPVGRLDFGDLRRVSPICADWGFSRGTAIDRYYIDRFIARHSGDIRGRVLELGTDDLTRRFGGANVAQTDVLHVEDAGPPVTIVGDLTTGAGLDSDLFDCALVTQTLHFIYDVHAVVRTLHRILKPGGVALVTVPGISKISPEDMKRWGQYWTFTSLSARRLFEEAFQAEGITVEAQGNVLAATAFLMGLAVEELTEAELDHVDQYYETLVGVRAQKLAPR